MAILTDSDIEFELFPRKYEEDSEDPFIFSLLRLEKGNKSIENLYGAILLKSEYEEMVANLSFLIDGKTSNYLLDPAEPGFIMEIMKETDDHYTWIITLSYKEERSLYFHPTKDSVQNFYNELQHNLANVQNPPYLP